MHRSKHLMLLLLLGLIVSSCAHAPKAPNDTAAIEDFRHEYLSSNPDGRFNRHILKGEVVRGMSYVEVMASWGAPQCRRFSNDRETEFWEFVEKDMVTSDWERYTLLFEKSVLSDWELARHFVKNGALSVWDFNDRDPLFRHEYRIPLSDETVLKR